MEVEGRDAIRNWLELDVACALSSESPRWHNPAPAVEEELEDLLCERDFGRSKDTLRKH